MTFAVLCVNGSKDKEVFLCDIHIVVATFIAANCDNQMDVLAAYKCFLVVTGRGLVLESRLCL